MRSFKGSGSASKLSINAAPFRIKPLVCSTSLSRFGLYANVFYNAVDVPTNAQNRREVEGWWKVETKENPGTGAIGNVLKIYVWVFSFSMMQRKNRSTGGHWRTAIMQRMNQFDAILSVMRGDSESAVEGVADAVAPSPPKLAFDFATPSQSITPDFRIVDQEPPRKVTVDGRDCIEFEFTLRDINDAVEGYTMTYLVDPHSTLPFAAIKSSGDTRIEFSIHFDQTAPTSLFEIGVPRDSKEIDLTEGF